MDKGPQRVYAETSGLGGCHLRNQPMQGVAMQRAKVLLADDDARFIKRIRQFLASETELEIVGEASDGQAAILKARELRPDLVLMDIRMPKMTGLEVTRHLKAEMPALTVIILTVFDLREYREAAAACGASAFVPKRDMQTRLLTELRALGFAPRTSSEAKTAE